VDAWNIQWGFTEPGTSEMQPCGAEFIGQWYGWHDYDQRFKIWRHYYYIFFVYHFVYISFSQFVCTSFTISSDDNSIDLPCTSITPLVIADITLFSQEIQAVSAMKILHGEKLTSQAVTVDHSWS